MTGRTPWTPPEQDTFVEVVPGLLWLRLALPFALDHVNVYLLEDGDGWAIFDAGFGNHDTKAAWDRLLAGPLAGMRFTRLIVSHHHPDHVGLAGWLCARFSIPLYMHEQEYLLTRHMSREPSVSDEDTAHAFYTGYGLDVDQARLIATRGMRYRLAVTTMPPACNSLVAGMTLDIGNRRLEVFTGGGHSAEQLMLWCPADKILLSADQVMLRISPNVSVEAVFPRANPLKHYLASLAELRATLPEGALILPGHNTPFSELHTRAAELATHHDRRLDAIQAACSGKAMSLDQIVQLLFPRAMDAHQLGFAFGEALAHVNFLVDQGTLGWTHDSCLRIK